MRGDAGLLPRYQLNQLLTCCYVHTPQTTTAKRQRSSGGSQQGGHPDPLLAAIGTVCGAAARLLGPTVILLHLLLGTSRAVSMALNFTAPIELFAGFAREQQAARRAAAPSLARHSAGAVSVCVYVYVGVIGGHQSTHTSSQTF